MGGENPTLHRSSQPVSLAGRSRQLPGPQQGRGARIAQDDDLVPESEAIETLVKDSAIAARTAGLASEI